jgi:hypothetical protein
MANALKHPHPEVPFAKVGDDTIKALAQVATIFKNKFQKPTAPELIQAPLKAVENTQPAALAHPILTYPMQHNDQTRSQRTISANSTQHAITSEGGHTNDDPGIISEGAGANTKYFPQKFVTRRFLEHGNRQPGNCIGRQ